MGSAQGRTCIGLRNCSHIAAYFVFGIDNAILTWRWVLTRSGAYVCCSDRCGRFTNTLNVDNGSARSPWSGSPLFKMWDVVRGERWPSGYARRST
jgi:hypothetical protein